MSANESPTLQPIDRLDGFAFDTKEVAKIFKCSRKKLEADRVYDRGLPYVRIGGLIRYLGEDILGAMKSNRHVPGQGDA